MFEKLALYMQYPFVRYAVIVGVLIALCSSLLGVTLVLKRFCKYAILFVVVNKELRVHERFNQFQCLLMRDTEELHYVRNPEIIKHGVLVFTLYHYCTDEHFE